MAWEAAQKFLMDDFELPPPLVRSRPCSTKGCSRQARPSGYDCRKCNAVAFRRWHAKNREKLKEKRRPASANRTEEERASDSARAKLSMAIKRGQIKRGLCIECLSDKTTAYIADPAEWRKVIWVCREHRQATVTEIEMRARTIRQRDEQAIRRERALLAFEALPARTQTAIRERAARGPMGITLDPQSPLYQQRLITEAEKAK